MKKPISPELHNALYRAASQAATIFLIFGGMVACHALTSREETTPVKPVPCIPLPAKPSICAKQTLPVIYCMTDVEGVCFNAATAAGVLNQ